MKETPMADYPGKAGPQTPDDQMSQKEKEEYVDKTQEFEGPDPREVRGDEAKHPHEPGVSRS
jgi:hypothetical protein